MDLYNYSLDKSIFMALYV